MACPSTFTLYPFISVRFSHNYASLAMTAKLSPTSLLVFLFQAAQGHLVMLGPPLSMQCPPLFLIWISYPMKWLMKKANLANFTANALFHKGWLSFLLRKETWFPLVINPTVSQGSHFPRTSRAIRRISFSSHPTLASSAPKPLPWSASLLSEKAGCFLDLSASILQFLTELRGKEWCRSLTPLTRIVLV